MKKGKKFKYISVQFHVTQCVYQTKEPEVLVDTHGGDVWSGPSKSIRIQRADDQTITLTHIRLGSVWWDIGKPCRPRMGHLIRVSTLYSQNNPLEFE